MSRDNQSEWPRGKPDGSERNSPTGYFQTPDVIQKSTRSLAGPLRLGTEPRVGPRGGRTGTFGSDMGMDRVTPREMDPMGTSASRSPQVREPSDLISREIRRGRQGRD